MTPWLAAAVVLGLRWLGRGYTADDAFITGRYAMRLAAGHGYTFRDGPATDGLDVQLHRYQARCDEAQGPRPRF